MIIISDRSIGKSRAIGSVSVCSLWSVSNFRTHWTMTYNSCLALWFTTLVIFERSQGYRSKFTVTEWKCFFFGCDVKVVCRVLCDKMVGDWVSNIPVTYGCNTQHTAVKTGLSERTKKHVLTPLRWKDWERFCGFRGQQRKQMSGFLTKLE